MSIVNGKFNLDHFLTSCPPDDFDSVKQLVGRWKNVELIQDFNGNVDFESVYIRTKDGHYVELINRRNPKDTPNSIVVNTFSSPLQSESELEALIGEKLNWGRTKEVRKVPDNGSFASEDVGKDWFYVWFIKEKIAQDEFAGVWLMDYQDKKFNPALSSKKFKSKDYAFKQVLRVKWTLTGKKFEVMKLMKWSTNNFRITGDSMVFSINNPNGKAVEFEFVKDDLRKPGYKQIILEKMDKEEAFSVPDTSFIELLNQNGQITLNFNEY